MKKLSIKARVTLWYSFLMAALTVAVMYIIFIAGGQQISESVRLQLQSAVSEAIEDIEYEGPGWINTSDVSYYDDGVYVLVYDADGYYIQGQLPSKVQAEQTPNFYDGNIQEFSVGQSSYLSLDAWRSFPDGSGVWVRGIVSQTYADSGLKIVVNIALIALPLFIVLIIIGGYIITKRAFRPVQKIRKTAEEIADSNDLSRRIGLKGGNDEIYQLGYTFDKMLDRIESSFEREKQFTSDASHELRTPIAVISAQAEYALNNDISCEEQKETLKTILLQSRKMSSLVSQLLTLSRADRGAVKLNFEKINLSELLSLISEEEQDRADSKGIVITQCIQPGIYVRADETLLMRCFINLIENAIVYGKENGHIWVYLTLENGKASGYVRDDGMGIAAKDLPKIWERFYQADPSRSDTGDGNSGLGLAMVRWIVNAHGGRIYAESTLGEGSTFYFEFDYERDST